MIIWRSEVPQILQPREVSKDMRVTPILAQVGQASSACPRVHRIVREGAVNMSRGAAAVGNSSNG